MTTTAEPIEEFTPNCRCDKAKIRIYLDHNNPEEGRLVVDHEPVNKLEGVTWKGGLCIERSWKGSDGKERKAFVLLDFSEVERVRDAMNVFLFDHTL